VGKDFPEELHFMSVNLLSINMSLTSMVAQWGLHILAAAHMLPCYVSAANTMSEG